MSRLNALITLVVLATSSAALADPTVSGRVTIRVSPPTLPAVIIRDRGRPAPRGYVRFDDYDARYDRVERIRIDQNFTGTYDSKYGRVYLTQNGNRVTGTYDTGGGGVIKGRIHDGALYYRWRQAGSEGHGVWLMNGRTREIAGTWGTFESDNNAGAWNVQRISGASRGDDNRDRNDYRDRRDDRSDDRDRDANRNRR